MSTHEGHRERLRERFRRHGLDNFNDLNVLELLLFYVIPRQDTNALAHRLLDQFGGLAAVLEAAPEDLQKVEGVGEHTAWFLKLITQLDRRYLISRAASVTQIKSSEDAGKVLVPKYRFAREEQVYLLSLDSRNRLIACDQVGQGSFAEVTVSLRVIVELALKRNAAAVILSHNHVNGFAIPSQADQETTRRAAEALTPVGVRLMDHLVVAGDDFVSFADSGLMDLCRRR